MIIMRKKFYLLMFTSLLLGTASVGYAVKFEVQYDQKQDLLSIQADQVPLTQVLTAIATQTGVQILIDPSINKTVSFRLSSQPLQKALQKVCKGLSYVIEYRVDSQKRSVVSGLRLLPKGKQDTGQLVSITKLYARASRFNGGGDSDYKNPASQSRDIIKSKQLDDSRQQVITREGNYTIGGNKNILSGERASLESGNEANKLREDQVREIEKLNPSSSSFGQ